jgi:parvulin-like peptidyl-prolyl isomerase
MRETHTRAERESEVQRLVVLGVAAAAAIAAVILIVALVFDQFVTPGQAVASVNGQTITVGEFQRRVRLERFFISGQVNAAIAQYQAFGFDDQTIQQEFLSQPPLSTYINELNIPDQLGNRVIDTMVDDAIVRQEAAARGIAISPEDVQERVNEFFGYDPNALLITPTPTLTPTVSPTPFVSPTPSPTATETPIPTATPTSEFTPTPSLTPVSTATPTPTPDATQRADEFNTNRGDYYAAIRADTGLSDADINTYFEMQALRDALTESVTAELTRTTPFVNARHILVATEAEANDVLAALQSGESFAALAATVSLNTQNNTRGGDLGWAPPTDYVDEFADAVREGEIGVYLGPIQTDDGWHIIQVRAREDREMTDDEFERAQQSELQDFIEAARDAAGGNIEIFNTWIDYVPRT